jgi:hypothetical protein
MGHYVGFDKGEFGGGLRFRSKQGEWRTLLEGHPVPLIVRDGPAILAVVRELDSTLIYRIEDGKSLARAPWSDLPGHPIRVEPRTDRRLVAETTVGVFEVSAEGQIREGSCSSWSD